MPRKHPRTTIQSGASPVPATITFPSSALSPSYDTRFGTSVDADGWIDHALKSGCRRVYVDSVNGNDTTGTGLSTASAKATHDAGWAVFTNGSFTPGDQFMVAGGEGQTYTNNHTIGNLSNYSGFSAQYLTAIRSYDSRDAANTSLYGRLVGPDMPSVSLPNGASSYALAAPGAGAGKIAIQGVELKAVSSAADVNLNYTYEQTDLCFQNLRMNGVRLAIDSAGSTISRIGLSKIAFWGAWASDGNGSGLYTGGTDALIDEDLVFAHCGWKIGATRDTAVASGGPSLLGHGHYHHYSNVNAIHRRIVGVDAATDTHNYRGGGVCSALVSLDEPVIGTFGRGLSGDSAFATCDDMLAMGGSDFNSGDVRGNGPGFASTQAGSYMNKLVLADHYSYNNGAHHWAVQSDHADVFTTADFRNCRSYLWSPYLHPGGGAGAYPANVTETIHDCILDVAATGTNNSVHSGLTTFPNAKTRAQVYTAMGFGSKAALVNAMLWRPDLPWAQALITIGLPSLGLTPTYATVAPPDLSGLTPATIY